MGGVFVSPRCGTRGRRLGHLLIKIGIGVVGWLIGIYTYLTGPVRGSSSTGSSHSILSLLSASGGRHPRRLPRRNPCQFGTQRELPRLQSLRAQEIASSVFSLSGLGAEDDHLLRALPIQPL